MDVLRALFSLCLLMFCIKSENARLCTACIMAPFAEPFLIMVGLPDKAMNTSLDEVMATQSAATAIPPAACPNIAEFMTD